MRSSHLRGKCILNKSFHSYLELERYIDLYLLIIMQDFWTAPSYGVAETLSGKKLFILLWCV